MKKILIIDYGLGNISSVKNTLNFLKFDFEIVSNHSSKVDIKNIKGFILPGVGSFPVGMQNLKERKLDFLLKELVKRKIPGIGICLGMQLFSEWSMEGGTKCYGLGFLNAGVVKMDNNYGKVPHIGWTLTKEINKTKLNLNFDCDFYYVHSYVVVSDDKNLVVATFHHGKSNYSAAIYKNNLLGVQFHPEKSQENGLILIKNFFKSFE